MWRNQIALLLTLMTIQNSRGESRIVEKNFFSRILNTNRMVRVYLPASYHLEPNRRYPVLYLHDGQNMFSWMGKDIAFGWGSWELDKTVDELCRTGKMLEIILVAVDNSPARYAEYCGGIRGGAVTNLVEPTPPGGPTPFEKYAAFLIQELKPKIDLEYRTQAEAVNTGVLGSSLGGICSATLAWEHPETFGRAASLSGSFQVEQTNFLMNVLRPYQGKPKLTRLYFDSGTVDFAGGDDGRLLTEAVAGELRRIGWGKELMHYVDVKPLTPDESERAGLRRDKWAEAQTSQHNEFYWRLRAWRALTFLFPPEKK